MGCLFSRHHVDFYDENEQLISPYDQPFLSNLLCCFSDRVEYQTTCEFQVSDKIRDQSQVLENRESYDHRMRDRLRDRLQYPIRCYFPLNQTSQRNCTFDEKLQ